MPNKWSFGEFNKKLKEALCHLRQTESFTPWLNAVKPEIKEVRKGSNRKLITFGAPERLCDNCFELLSYIRSNTAHNIFKMDGEVLETIFSWETSDISQFCEFEWFEWVLFQDEMAPNLDDHFKLGGCLDSNIDIDPALIAKIIKENGQVLYRFTYQALTQGEWE